MGGLYIGMPCTLPPDPKDPNANRKYHLWRAGDTKKDKPYELAREAMTWDNMRRLLEYYRIKGLVEPSQYLIDLFALDETDGLKLKNAEKAAIAKQKEIGRRQREEEGEEEEEEEEEVDENQMVDEE